MTNVKPSVGVEVDGKRLLTGAAEYVNRGPGTILGASNRRWECPRIECSQETRDSPTRNMYVI